MDEPATGKWMSEITKSAAPVMPIRGISSAVALRPVTYISPSAAASAMRVIGVLMIPSEMCILDKCPSGISM